MGVEDSRRVDKWLWFARLAKTRTLAQKLVVAGKVRINREKSTSASRLIKVGDVLTVALDSRVRVLRVVAVGTRRGPASEAQMLYDDLSPPAPADATTEPMTGLRPRHNARPTKRERRALQAFKRPSDEDFSRRGG